MHLCFATLPGSAQTNEDWAGATPQLAVVLDGITTPPGMDDTGCIHSTPWFVAALGTNLLSTATLLPNASLQTILRSAITKTADSHSHTCDISRGATPSAAVAMIRTRNDDLDYLVLSDAFVLLATPTSIAVHTDLRGHTAVADLRAEVFSHPIGSNMHRENRKTMVDVQRSKRNQSGGYWVAAGQPEAADHAITGSLPVADVRHAAALSDGAAALVEYDLADWPDLITILDQDGPLELLHRVRKAEATDPLGIKWPRFKPNDDATVAFCTF